MPISYYRVWDPSRSPVRIEYPVDLFEEVQQVDPAAGLDRGFLIGIQRGPDVRILLARRSPEDAGPRGTQRVGIFVTRPRGEVFLTEDDLGFMQDHQAHIALVIAGARAGFFVRELDGSLQAVRSYEEFLIHPELPRRPPRLSQWASSIVGQDGILRAIVNRAGSLKPEP